MSREGQRHVSSTNSVRMLGQPATSPPAGTSALAGGGGGDSSGKCRPSRLNRDLRAPEKTSRKDELDLNILVSTSPWHGKFWNARCWAARAFGRRIPGLSPRTGKWARDQGWQATLARRRPGSTAGAGAMLVVGVP